LIDIVERGGPALLLREKARGGDVRALVLPGVALQKFSFRGSKGQNETTSTEYTSEKRGWIPRPPTKSFTVADGNSNLDTAERLIVLEIKAWRGSRFPIHGLILTVNGVLKEVASLNNKVLWGRKKEP